MSARKTYQNDGSVCKGHGTQLESGRKAESSDPKYVDLTYYCNLSVHSRKGTPRYVVIRLLSGDTAMV